MAERALIDELMMGGLAEDEAERAADTVLAAIGPVLLTGKTVRVPGIGRLSAPLKRGIHPSKPSMTSEYRRARLGSPGTLYRGEPDVPAAVEKKTVQFTGRPMV